MENKKYILFGAGEQGKRALRFFKRDNILVFCDSYMYGNEIEGIQVISPQELDKYVDMGEIIITALSVENRNDIARILKEMKLEYNFFDEAALEVVRAEARKYEMLNKRSQFSIEKRTAYLRTMDRIDEAGKVNIGFWEDQWTAKHVYEKRPVLHYDIGSSVARFIWGLLLFGQRVCQIDIRPLSIDIGTEFIKDDATELDGIEDNSIESLSAISSLEHIGLGRYGDPIDPEGCFKCFRSIQNKVKVGGDIYITVPVGREHVEFNAHRVFNALTIVDEFNQCDLIEYSVAKEDGIEYNVDLCKYDNEPDIGWSRMGLFHFRKR